MESPDILRTVDGVFKKVFKNDGIAVSLETSPKDIKQWDSLNHIHLVVELEKQFGIRFQRAEIRGWKNVGDMCATVKTILERKSAAKP